MAMPSILPPKRVGKNKEVLEQEREEAVKAKRIREAKKVIDMNEAELNAYIKAHGG
jgi:hypothetical protein